jgi:hypothetical protein
MLVASWRARDVGDWLLPGVTLVVALILVFLSSHIVNITYWPDEDLDGDAPPRR